ncbi:tRNA 4-thiouridine(8) synthase ThiI, partial [Candidatus Azambacteria bacterium]|nr:tRNA 4-thiouridine(8) synthase ThiI [Candidatus Azambacteria bacterium]
MGSEKIALIHYHEISLKGGNRPLFEKALLANIKTALGGWYEKGKIFSGRIAIALGPDADEDAVKERLRRVFGIANFAFTQKLSSDFETFSQEAFDEVARKEFGTFRIAARRSDKSFPVTSQEINERLGLRIKEQLGKKVDLDYPDLTCFLEIAGKEVFLYFEKEKGYGGLPVGTSGRVLSLLSSGFDSPVAAWSMMRRGCEVAFVHFHSYPSTSQASQENVKEIAKILTQYQYHSTLYLVPFLPVQKAMLAAIADTKKRVILYRRFMMRIAERVAEKAKYGALVTGDSLGQVASQTLENIAVISAAVSMP